MMHKIDCIRSLLDDSYLTDTKYESALRDLKNDMEVNMIGVPDNGLIFNVPEKGKAHIGVLSKEIGLRQSCDYLIFIPYSNGMDVYFIEMKKSLRLNKKGIPQKACDQILHTVPVLRYLVSMAKIHFGIELGVRIYFAVIAKKETESLSKQGVKPNIPKVLPYKEGKLKIFHSSMKIPWRHLR